MAKKLSLDWITEAEYIKKKMAGRDAKRAYYARDIVTCIKKLLPLIATKKQVDIYLRRINGETLNTIAKDYGVNMSTISRQAQSVNTRVKAICQCFFEGLGEPEPEQKKWTIPRRKNLMFHVKHIERG